MSTLNDVNGENIMFTKGAADVLVDRMNCTHEEKEQIKAQVSELSAQGLRILCFASKKYNVSEITTEDEYGLDFIGLIAMMDPPRAESKQAVAECKTAGIKPVMITGDHIVTASAIAKEIGILNDFSEAVEGSALDGYSDEELISFVRDKSVYARVTPEHKIRIVKSMAEQRQDSRNDRRRSKRRSSIEAGRRRRSNGNYRNRGFKGRRLNGTCRR